jgi:hypothetical protein
VLAIAGILAIGIMLIFLLLNMLVLVPEEKTELSYNPDGSANTSSSAMSREYITEYSYGVAEVLI